MRHLSQLVSHLGRWILYLWVASRYCGSCQGSISKWRSARGIDWDSTTFDAKDLTPLLYVSWGALWTSCCLTLKTGRPERLEHIRHSPGEHSFQVNLIQMSSCSCAPNSSTMRIKMWGAQAAGRFPSKACSQFELRHSCRHIHGTWSNGNHT